MSLLLDSSLLSSRVSPFWGSPEHGLAIRTPRPNSPRRPRSRSVSEERIDSVGYGIWGIVEDGSLKPVKIGESATFRAALNRFFALAEMDWQ